MEMKWYEFDQNNSGGYFVVDNEVCHTLYIEAESFDDAVEKAEELGCYWDGVDKGMDCPCCGDRWNKWNDDPVDIEKYSTIGYEVSVYDGIYSDTVAQWNEKYGEYKIIEEPTWENTRRTRKYAGRIGFSNIEEYAQYLANEFGWTTPDARIYYNNGNVKEIFSKKVKR